jgi:hypothetical protein
VLSAVDSRPCVISGLMQVYGTRPWTVRRLHGLFGAVALKETREDYDHLRSSAHAVKIST